MNRHEVDQRSCWRPVSSAGVVRRRHVGDGPAVPIVGTSFHARYRSCSRYPPAFGCRKRLSPSGPGPEARATARPHVRAPRSVPRAVRESRRRPACSGSGSLPSRPGAHPPVSVRASTPTVQDPGSHTGFNGGFGCASAVEHQANSRCSNQRDGTGQHCAQRSNVQREAEGPKTHEAESHERDERPAHAPHGLLVTIPMVREGFEGRPSGSWSNSLTSGPSARARPLRPRPPVPRRVSGPRAVDVEDPPRP